MTWLPVARGDTAELDAVLGLKPEIHAAVREALELAWRIADPRLLDLCRLRLAQLAGARAELAGVDERLLSELDAWHSSDAFSDRERAALSFAEQYYIDHKLISDEQRADLGRHLSRREVVNFVWALHMNDAYARVLSLLDVEPDPPSGPARRERMPPAAGPGKPWLGRPDADPADVDLAQLQDPEFADFYVKFGSTVVRRSLVDEVTSEAVRLRNASHQGCLY